MNEQYLFIVSIHLSILIFLLYMDMIRMENQEVDKVVQKSKYKFGSSSIILFYSDNK